MTIQILQLPYDSGRRAERMAKGPLHFVEHGMVEFLAARGHTAQVTAVELETFPYPPGMETRAAFDLYAHLSGAVFAAVKQGLFPLVLSGNCGAALGTISGLAQAGGEPAGILWLDAHGDYNTPEISRSGFLDGMGLATAAGLCWQNLAASIPGFRPVPSPAILHLGSRDLDAPERELMLRTGVGLLPADQITPASLDAALDRLAAQVGSLYLHFDLDVLDPSLAPANHFPAPAGGIRPDQAVEIVQHVRQRLAIRAIGLASYDPNYDPAGKARQAALQFLETAL